MPTRKPPERRQGRGTADLEVLPGGEPIARPALPSTSGGSLLKATVTAWETFWSDDLLSRLVRPADLAPLGRLFLMYDERERAERAYRKSRAVEGSTGQLVVNPFAKQVASLDQRIEKLEARFGITPRARLELGIAMGMAHKSLEEMNRAFDDDATEDEHSNDVDPRLQAIDTTAS